MSDLTDLEICKKIAEIEVLDFYLLESEGGIHPSIKVWQDSVLKEQCVPKKYFEQHDYSPLTDDGLCFKLMVKYETDFSILTGLLVHQIINHLFVPVTPTKTAPYS